MMDTFALIAHLDTLGLSAEGKGMVLEAVMADESGRATRSGAVNLSGLFPSRKCGWTVQWESKVLELAKCWVLEGDQGVLLWVDQPMTLSWFHRPPEGAGRGFPVNIHPDFLVIRTDGVFLLDLEREAALRELMRTSVGYVTQDADGSFHRPGAEAKLEGTGIRYLIETERDVPPILPRNLAYLAPASERAPLDPAVATAIRTRVVAGTGDVRLIDLVLAFGADDVHAAIVQGVIFANLDRDVLDDPEHVFVFPDAATARIYAARTSVAWALGNGRPAVLRVEPGATFAFDGQTLTIVVVGPEVVLVRGERDGRTFHLRRDEIEAYWREGTITLADPGGVADDPTAQLREEIRAARPLTEASLRKAVEKSETLARFERDQVLPAGVALITIRRWQRERREVEAVTHDPLLGLVPVKHPGNTKTRVDERALPIATEVILERYLTPERRSIAECWGEFAVRCKTAKYRAFSIKTFAKLVKAHSSHRENVLRYGRKGAYGTEAPAPIVPDAADPNGCYPLAVVHVDYTLADLELVDRLTGENLGRPGVFRLLDGYSGFTLALIVSFDKPGKRTTLRLLRRLVRNIRRFPELLMGDLGSEHRNLELRALAAYYGFVVAWRPASKPRYGSPIERSFGRLTTELINGLVGNTQATKQVRTLTPQTDPANRAVWDLESFTRLIEDYLSIAEDEFDPELRTSPRKAFVNGFARHGERPTRLIAEDDTMRRMTMPFAPGTTRIIGPVEGVVFEGRSYYAPAFAGLGVAGSDAEVRVDDDNASYVSVLVGDQWIDAFHASTSRQRVTSEAEAAILTDEIRAAWRRAERDRPARLERLGVLHSAAVATEAALIKERAAAAAASADGADATAPAPATVDPTTAVTGSAIDLYADDWNDSDA
jgi:putative transposase